MLLCTASIYAPRENQQLTRKVCPCCANLLSVGRIPEAEGLANPNNQRKYRFECKTCPYQQVIKDRSLYDRKILKRKEVEDVVGDQDVWRYAETTEGMTILIETHKVEELPD